MDLRACLCRRYVSSLPKYHVHRRFCCAGAEAHGGSSKLGPGSNPDKFHLILSLLVHVTVLCLFRR